MGAVSIDFVIYQSSKKEKHDSISFKLPPYRADGTVESLQCFDKRLLHYTKDDAIISYRNPVRDSMEREQSTEFLQCFFDVGVPCGLSMMTLQACCFRL